MPSARSQDLIDAETDFAIQLLATFPTNESTVLSPLSISLALSLVHLGAKGFTKDQITQAVLKGSSDDEIEKHFEILNSLLKKSENGVETQIANRIFANEGSTIKSEYLANAQSKYAAGAENLNFGEAETSANTINEYITKHTGGKINKLVSSDSLRDTFAILINAVYFKGDWQEQFESQSTSTKSFHSSTSAEKSTAFLNEYTTHRDYTENETFQVLSLRYVDPSFTFVVFLPKQRFGLAQALEDLDGAKFQNLINNLGNQYLNISIPKFKIEKSTDLKETLQKIGITEIFETSADISDLADNIHISSAVHNSLIEVDENGTTAAAATSIKAHLEMMIMADPIEFNADHPFLFALLKDKSPLFIGIHA